ncbi:creatininase family protein [Thermoanaerobacterium sp. DL9XJH110]|uniref:creatininase family protein n=1 Tax=Thermoanaerobacterium sp. DL9XJH110 TaxID=3386643 RepID=UPI003BB803AC
MGEILAEMRRPDVEKRFNEGAVAILPIGATEQHGPHLPYGTDTFAAVELAKRLNERLNNGILLPPVPFGYSWVWRNIPGCIVLKEDTVKALIKDIAVSLSRNGCRKFVIINGHEANNRPIKFAIRELSDEKVDIKILYFFYPDMRKFIENDMESALWNGMLHACEFETSVMLAVKEELVDMNKAVKEYPATPYDYGFSDDYLGDLSKSGVFGDPTRAAKEKGEKIIAASIRKIESILKNDG